MVWLGEQWTGGELSAGLPTTRVAEVWFSSGAGNMSMRLLTESATQRAPAESKEIPDGPASPEAVEDEDRENRSTWPITRDAAMPVVSGFEYRRTRLFPLSESQRFPAALKAKWPAPQMPLGVRPHRLVPKEG